MTHNTDNTHNTTKSHNTGIKTMQKVMENRGKSRIWLQSLAAYGWPAGKAYTVAYQSGGNIVITATVGSKRKVGPSKDGLIEISNKNVTAWANSHTALVTHVDFRYYNDRIEITPARHHVDLPRAHTQPDKPQEDRVIPPSVSVKLPKAVKPTTKPKAKQPNLDDIMNMMVC